MKAFRMMTSTSALVLALVILISIGAISFQGSVILLQDTEAVHQSQEVLTHSTALLSGITDAETGQRGYLITGNTNYLTPYRESRAAVDAAMQSLRRLHPGDDSEKSALDSLEALLHQRFSQLASVIELRDKNGFEAARQIIASGVGKRIHDTIRTRIAELQQAEYARLNSRSAQARQAARFTQVCIAGGGLLTAVLCGVAVILRHRDQIARHRAEAEVRSNVQQLEHRIAERTSMLVESESRLRLALDASRLGTYDWNLPNHQMVWSRWHEEIWGFAPGEFHGTVESFESRVHPDDLPSLKAEVTRCLESREPFAHEYRLVLPDGTVHWVWDKGEFDYDASGRALHMRGVVMDITARKRVEESALRWQRIFEASQFGLACGCATTNTLLDVNEAFARERGFTRQEMIGREILDHYPPEMREHLRKQLEQVDQTGHAVFDAVHQRKDGSRFPVLVELTSILDARGQSTSRIAYALNISDRKQAEEALRQRNEELMRFIYTVSHDLKSPLVTIRTFLGYLERDLKDQDAAKVDTDLGYIRKAAEKMSDLLDEILELSRVGRKVNPPEEILLQSLVSDALDIVAGPISAGKVAVEVTQEPLLLVGDRRRLLELFQNLIDNAVKFMGDQPAPRIEIGAEVIQNETILFVRDNGIGIDPRHRDKLFGLFEKLHPGFPGNGVGLAIVKRIVEIHGGRIWAESEGVGHGASFRFTLENIRRLPPPTEASPC